MPSLDYKDPQVITDAVRLLKSDFVALYTEMGFDKNELGPAWHKIRTSGTGNELLCKLYKNAKHVQALTSISDFKDEADVRKKAAKKKKNKK